MNSTRRIVAVSTAAGALVVLVAAAGVVAGEGECLRLRITFGGPAPPVRVFRPSEGNHTSVRLAPDAGAAVEPAGPVSPDLLWPGGELLSTAMLTSDGGGWPGGPRRLRVTGAPDRGLAVLHTAGSDGGWVVVQGYARAPESHVVVRVHEGDGDGVICDRPQLAAGPPYPFSWFHEACAVPRTGAYQVEVGWHDPAGTGSGVWQWYDVTVD